MHDKYSPSQLQRLLLCPGSYNFCKDIKDPPTSKYAKEGTKAHEEAEKYLNQWLETGVLKPKHMNEHVKVYVDHIYNLTNSIPLKKKFHVGVEKKVSLDWLCEGVSGTADCVIEIPFEEIYVIDYKHGAGVAVEVDGNPQLMAYGLGAAHNRCVEKVHLVIVQPRVDHPLGPVRTKTYDYKSLLAWGEKVLKPAIAKLETSIELVPGEKQCRFCKGKSTCPAMYKNTLEMAKLDFMPVEKKELPHIVSLTKKEISSALKASKIFTMWVRELEKFAREELEKGGDIPEYKLVKKRANRRWIDEERVVKELQDVNDELHTKKLKSPAQIEKLVGKERVKEMWYKPPVGNTIAHESDRRKAVDVILDAAEDFRED